MLVLRRTLGQLAAISPARLSLRRGWFCPGGEQNIWLDQLCYMVCASTDAELRALSANTRLDCPVTAVQTVEGPWTYVSSGGGPIPIPMPGSTLQPTSTTPAPAPTAPAPATQPQTTPSSPATAWNPPEEEAGIPPESASTIITGEPTTTTTTEETSRTERTEQTERPAVSKRWSEGLPAGLREIVEYAEKIPWWVWLLLLALLLARRKEAA